MPPDSVVTTHTLPDFPKTGTTVLAQARYAHSFAITSFSASPRKKTKDAAAEDVAMEKVRRDLLVVGCRKKVVVLGAGKGGMKDAWVSFYFRLCLRGRCSNSLM